MFMTLIELKKFSAELKPTTQTFFDDFCNRMESRGFTFDLAGFTKGTTIIIDLYYIRTRLHGIMFENDAVFCHPNHDEYFEPGDIDPNPYSEAMNGLISFIFRYTITIPRIIGPLFIHTYHLPKEIVMMIMAYHGRPYKLRKEKPKLPDYFVS